MKYALFAAASAFCLCACNKGPSVDLKNASGNEVAAAVKQSGAMTDDAMMMEPGLWQSKVVIQEMSIPGLPPQFAEKMKQTMAEQRQHSNTHCLTAAELKKPKEDFFASPDKSCRYEHFRMGSGKIDIAMACREEGTSQTTNMSGTYTPTSYSMDMSSSGSGGPMGGMTMKMHVDSSRIGECLAKDG